MMEGPDSAKLYVTTYLAKTLDDRLVKYRNAWNLDDVSLPTPRKFLDYEPTAVDAWPTVITLVINTTDIERGDFDDAFNPIYRVTYSMRTYVWVKADRERATTMMRDRLTTVVREALLDNASLQSVDLRGQCEALIDESTMREEYSDLTPLKGDRFMAGAYVAYDLNINETLTRDNYADQLLGLDVIVTKMDITPNAPTQVLAAPGDTQVTLTWDAPTWDGGISPVNGYRIESSIDGGTNWTTSIADTGSTSETATVTGLVNGVIYTFRVRALNQHGAGTPSANSNTVTPTA